MKPEVAFFSGAVLGVAGAYLYKNYENGKDLKGGEGKSFTTLERIKNLSTIKEINDFCSKYKKKYGCKYGVLFLFSKDDTVLARYPSSKRSSTYTIPDSVTSIGSNAFEGCTSLETITIPDSVTSIGSNAFEGCTSLETITIPDSVTSIGDEAFFNCGSLKNIQIPKSVISIGKYSFSSCTSLTTISVEKDNNVYSSIDGVLFDKNQTKLIIYPSAKIGISYKIPESVTSIEESAFKNCSSLETITIPAGVTSIGPEAFYNCTLLKTITIPSGVTSIGDGAFYECTSLTSIIIPNGVTSIGKYAFYGCSSLETITIPTSVTSIGEYAFDRCSSLETITIPSTLIKYINKMKVLTIFYVFSTFKDETGASYERVKDKLVLQKNK